MKTLGLGVFERLGISREAEARAEPGTGRTGRARSDGIA